MVADHTRVNGRSMRNPDPLRDDPIEALAAGLFVVVVITFLVFAAGVMIVFL